MYIFVLSVSVKATEDVQCIEDVLSIEYLCIEDVQSSVVCCDVRAALNNHIKSLQSTVTELSSLGDNNRDIEICVLFFF